MHVPVGELDFLKRALAVYPDKEAVVCGNHRFTYRQFGERVNQWAQSMLGLGVRPGDRVTVLSQNCHRMLEAYFGAPTIGAIIMPVNFRLVPGDFLYMLNHSEAKVIIVEEGFTHLIDEIRDRLNTVEHFIVATDDSKLEVPGWKDYEALLSSAPDERLVPVETDENEPAALLYTSGTTGNPKGVMLTHRNIFFNSVNSIIELGLRDSDVYLHTLAMFHCNGWGVPYSVTGVGGKHVVVKKFEPGAFFDLAINEGMTCACMPPIMMNMALNHPIGENPPADLPRAVRIGTAGSAPPMATIKAMQERLGWQIVQVYGLTETSPFLTVSKTKSYMSHLSNDEKHRIQTRTGYPMLGVDLRVVDEDGNDIAADGHEVGEVIARSNVVMRGYWRDQEATDKVIVDGWFHTGDMATMDNEGYIEIVDRKKDLIISGGENVSSIEVEGMLYKHPAVLEAACVAIPDSQWGEAPSAIVVLKPGATATEAELIEFCRDNLAHFKCPRSVSFVDALPRTATGKIQKNQLRKKYWEGREKKVN
ncbi:MAG TPA: fatty acid--CoA ligase [Blastocatellia bacterium]|nr:fatty acid--CoA ligase [Blastocatellia bacterium]